MVMMRSVGGRRKVHKVGGVVLLQGEVGERSRWRCFKDVKSVKCSGRVLRRSGRKWYGLEEARWGGTIAVPAYLILLCKQSWR
jgi:hypothetical protein